MITYMIHLSRKNVIKWIGKLSCVHAIGNPKFELFTFTMNAKKTVQPTVPIQPDSVFKSKQTRKWGIEREIYGIYVVIQSMNFITIFELMVPFSNKIYSDDPRSHSISRTQLFILSFLESQTHLNN